MVRRRLWRYVGPWLEFMCLVIIGMRLSCEVAGKVLPEVLYLVRLTALLVELVRYCRANFIRVGSAKDLVLTSDVRVLRMPCKTCQLAR